MQYETRSFAVDVLRCLGDDALADPPPHAQNDKRYAALAPYLAFAPDKFTDYQPGGFTITIPSDLTKLTKATLKEGATTITY